MSDKIYVGQKCQTFKNLGEYPPVSRVTMWTDDEHYYTAGDDTGYEISAPCRSATQAIVDNALKQLKGFVYRPFEATGVDIDPAYEPGDAITIGGIYSFIGQDTRRFGAMGLCDISCPSKGEMEEEFPYLTPAERELKRRVKLGQPYQGVRITRAAGLTIVEMTEDGKEGAKVILNSKELSFYDAGGGRVLYFDPTSGTYKFMGELNVNDKFVVDKLGNVKLAGNINMSEGIFYYGENVPNKKRYAASTSGPWHDTMQSGDIYCCDWDYTAEKWGEAYKFKGQDGTNGSDADVTYSNIKTALDRASKAAVTFITGSSVDTADIFASNIYGGKISAGKGALTFTQMDGGGLSVFREGIAQSKVFIGMDEGGTTPQIQLGAGDGSGGNYFAIAKDGTSANLFYMSAAKALSGFRFRDGVIEPIGDFKGTAYFA